MILGSINKVLGLKAGGPADSHLLQSCEQAGGGMGGGTEVPALACFTYHISDLGFAELSCA